MLVIAGHGIFCFGILVESFPIMLLGRFINGSGCEPTIIGITLLVKLYIKEANVLFMNSSVMVVSRVAYSLSYYVNPKLYLMHNNFNYLLILSMFIVLVSFFAFMIFYTMAKRSTISNDAENVQEFKCRDLRGFT